VPTLFLPEGPVEICAVGLDIDGVQRDTAYLAYRTLAQTIVTLGGTPPSYVQWVRQYSHDFLGFYRSCGVSHTVERITEVYRGILQYAEDATAPFDDVASFLAYIDTCGLPAFVVSGVRIQLQFEWFVKHGIHEYFAHVVSSFGRPKVRLLEDACLALAIPFRAACYVGDLACDMQDARAAGLIPIGMTRGYDTRDVLTEAGAALVVDHLEELALQIVP